MKFRFYSNSGVVVTGLIGLALAACSNEPPKHETSNVKQQVSSVADTPRVEQMEASPDSVDVSMSENQTTDIPSSKGEDSSDQLAEQNSSDDGEIQEDDSLYQNYEAPSDTVAIVPLTSNRVEWSAPIEQSYERVTVSIAGSDGVLQTREFRPGESIEWSTALADGVYSWESVVMPEIDASVRQEMANVRAQGDLEAEQRLIARLRAEGSLPTEAQGNQNRQSGTFTVRDGIVRPSLVDGQKEVVDQ
jgi:hypothetical protein